MVIDEPAMWNLIPAAKQERVMCVAKAMCRSRDAEDDDMEHCDGCDTPEGGSCVAFGLYGHMAVEVVEALDRLGDGEVTDFTMSAREMRALMNELNEMRRTQNPLLEKWADRIQDAIEAAADEEAGNED